MKSLRGSDEERRERGRKSREKGRGRKGGEGDEE